MNTTTPHIHIIKGCPRDHWDEVQAIQHEPFIYIMSNGSKWAGEEADDIDALLKTLSEQPLDPRFEPAGEFITQNPCCGVPGPTRGTYVDGPRMYTANVTRFFGNFYTVSHVFQIDTNDQETIDALTKAIRKNIRSAAYRAAKREREEA